MVHSIGAHNTPWCNGSTSVFGSDSIGSNPIGVTFLLRGSAPPALRACPAGLCRAYFVMRQAHLKVWRIATRLYAPTSPRRQLGAAAPLPPACYSGYLVEADVGVDFLGEGVDAAAEAVDGFDAIGGEVGCDLGRAHAGVADDDHRFF